MCWHVDVFWLNVLSFSSSILPHIWLCVTTKWKQLVLKSVRHSILILNIFSYFWQLLFSQRQFANRTTTLKEFEKAQKLAHRKTSDFFFSPLDAEIKGVSCKDEARTPLTRNHTISRKLPSVLKLHFKVTVSPITTGGRGSMVTVK